MVRSLAVMLLVSALWLCAAAKGGIDFTNERFFRFGMDQGDAEDVLRDEKNWTIMYRRDTTQASSIACVYQKQVFYQVEFYQGRCYRVEKRAELPVEQVDPTYKYFIDKLKEPQELATSRDEKHIFARWTLKDREIQLSADERESGIYRLTYEEQDPITQQDAEYAMDNEVGSEPQNVDPITGKPRPAQPGDGTGSQEGGENGDAKKEAGKQDDGGEKKDEGKQDDGGEKKDEGKKDNDDKKDDSGGDDDTGGDGHDID